MFSRLLGRRLPATNKLHDIFVSYSSNDRIWVEKFVADLGAAVTARAGRHVPIWWDRQSIGPGDQWDEKMLDDAARARVFVPVVSPSWRNSDPCLRELAAFLASPNGDSLFPVIYCLPTARVSRAVREEIASTVFSAQNPGE